MGFQKKSSVRNQKLLYNNNSGIGMAATISIIAIGSTYGIGFFVPLD